MESDKGLFATLEEIQAKLQPMRVLFRWHRKHQKCRAYLIDNNTNPTHWPEIYLNDEGAPCTAVTLREFVFAETVAASHDELKPLAAAIESAYPDRLILTFTRMNHHVRNQHR